MKLKHLLIELFLIFANIILILAFVSKVGVMGIVYMLLGMVLGTICTLLLLKPDFYICKLKYEDNNFKVNWKVCGVILVLILLFLILIVFFSYAFVFGILMGFTVTWYLINYCGDLLYSVIIHNETLNDMLKRRFKWLK